MESARAIAAPLPFVGRQRARSRPSKTLLSAGELCLVAVLCALGSSVLSFLMGKDLNWDYFNYHGYVAFDIFGSRLGQDFFPAGYQGYMNRLAYLPFAWMDKAGWHSLVIASGLACIQSLNVFFLYLLARELTGDARRPRLVATVLTLLGVASNVFILQLGSTFVDTTTTPLVMCALWLIVRFHDPRMDCVAVALCGAAMALKLTNAPFIPGILAMVMVANGRDVGAVGRALACALAASVGFLALYGHWGWLLYQQFGSPVFPLFNNIFKAPDFPTEPIALHRFVPQSLGELFSLPFAMAEHRSWVYAEGVSPDLRPVCLIALAAAATATLVIRRFRVGAAQAPGTAADAATKPLLAFFVVSLVGWLVTSSNGRYATPLLLLLGPLLYVVGGKVIGAHRSALLCLVLLPLQVLQVHDAGNPRWGASDWSSRWLPADVPAEYAAQPGLYISTTTSSESYLAGHLHPDSVFINPIGLISLPTDGPGWNRFIALRERYVGRTRVVFAFGLASPPEARARRIDTMNAAIDRLGLQLIKSSCRTLAFNMDAAAIPYAWERKPDIPALARGRGVEVCDAEKLPAPSEYLAAMRAQATTIMNAFENKCPGIFAPVGTQVEGASKLWSRLYGKFDLFFTVEFGSGEIAYHMERQATDVVIGNIKTWPNDVERFRCRLPHNGARDISTLGGDATR